MKKDPIFLAFLSFISLLILQTVLIFILVSFSTEKPDMRNWAILTTNIPFLIMIWCSMKVFAIKFNLRFAIPKFKLFVFVMLLAICIVAAHPVMTLFSFASNIFRNTIAYTSLNFNLSSSLVFYYVNIVFLGPVLEEIFYRKIIQNEIQKKYHAVWAILISSLLFSIGHMNYLQIQMSFLFGLIAGYLYLKTKRITITILLHSLVNLFVIVTSDKIVEFDNYYYLLVLYLIIILCGYFLVGKIVQNAKVDKNV